MKVVHLIVGLACVACTSSTWTAGDITVPELHVTCGTLSGKGMGLVLVNNRRTYFKIDCGKEHYL